MGFEVVFECPDGNGLVLSDRTFADRIFNHITYARVRMGDSALVDHVFTADAPRLALPNTGAALHSDSVLRYAGLGFSHVYRSADMLCFMVALLLLAWRRRDYALAFGALAVGYAAASLLAASALASPRFDGRLANGLLILAAAVSAPAFAAPRGRQTPWVLGGGAAALALPAFVLHGEAAALAALGIALVAAASLSIPSRETGRTALVLILPFVFALLDGFTLPNDVSTLALPSGRLGVMAGSFNAGALAAETVLPVLFAGAWFLLPRLRRFVEPGRFVRDLATAAFTGLGVFWFSSWLYA